MASLSMRIVLYSVNITGQPGSTPAVDVHAGDIWALVGGRQCQLAEDWCHGVVRSKEHLLEKTQGHPSDET